MCIPLFAGYFGSPLPYKLPLHVAVGEPIEVPKCPEDQLEKKSGMPPRDMAKPYLERYAKALQELFERYKKEAGYPDDRHLVIEADFSAKEVGGSSEKQSKESRATGGASKAKDD